MQAKCKLFSIYPIGNIGVYSLKHAITEDLLKFWAYKNLLNLDFRFF